MTLETLSAIVGRTHPAVLHLPIGLTIGLCAVELWHGWRRRPAENAPPAGSSIPLLLWLSVGSCMLTTVSGLLLAREAMHAAGAVHLHRNLGLALTGVLALAALFHALGQRRAYLAALLLGAALIGPVGHFGGTLTHGEGYLLAPLRAEAAQPETSTEFVARDHDRPTFETHILPVLARRCTACHGASARKGGLRLDTLDAIRERGIVAGHPQKSELLRRVQLGDDNDQRMPPAPRAALPAHEIALIEAWIKAGGLPDTPFTIAPDTRTALGAGSAEVPDTEPQATPDTPAVPTPSEPAVARLREAFAHVAPVAPGLPNLWVDLTPLGTTVDDARFVELISDVAVSLGELRAARTKITDNAISALAAANGLTVLDLSWSNIGDAALHPLVTLPNLRVLRLVGTDVSDAGLRTVAKMPALQTVYLWRTETSAEALAQLARTRPDVEVIADAVGAEALEVEDVLHFRSDRPSPDAAANGRNANCPVSGRPVDKRYQVVQEGQVIGLCCPECARTFWEAPQRYLETSDE